MFSLSEEFFQSYLPRLGTTHLWVSLEISYPPCLESYYNPWGLGLKVKSWTCVGATPNRNFLRINSYGQELNYYTRNIFDQNRKIYFFSDVLHLLKTAKNNIENSLGNINSRNLMVIHFYWSLLALFIHVFQLIPLYCWSKMDYLRCINDWY